MARFGEFVGEFFLVLALVAAFNLVLGQLLAPALVSAAKAASMNVGSLRAFLLTLLTLLSTIPAGFLIFQKSRDLKAAFTIPAAASGLAIVALSVYSVLANFQLFMASSPTVPGLVADYFLSTAALAVSYFCIGLAGGILGAEIRFRTQKKSPRQQNPK